MRQRMEQHRCQPGVRQLSRDDGPARPLARELRCGRTMAHARRVVGADRRERDGARRHAVRGPRRICESTLLRSDRFVSTLTEKMLTYALGRGLEYYDAPAVRAILRDAAQDDYRFSALIVGIVQSAPFRMRKARLDQALRRVSRAEPARIIMFITKKALPRRTFLRGVGATLGLAAARRDGAGAVGAGADSGEPGASGSASFTCRTAWRGTSPASTTGRRPARARDFELSPILTPLAPYRDRLLVVSGLAQHQADAFDDGANGDHTRGTSSWLTGVHCKRTEGADVRNGVSADQIAAATSGQDDGAAVAGAGDRSQLPRRAVREQLQLRLPEHARVELGYDAAADREQSAHRVRAALWRWRHSASSAWRRRSATEHPRLGDWRSCEAAEPRSAVAIAQPSTEYRRRGARGRAAHSARRSGVMPPNCRRSNVLPVFPIASTSTSS